MRKSARLLRAPGRRAVHGIDDVQPFAFASAFIGRLRPTTDAQLRNWHSLSALDESGRNQAIKSGRVLDCLDRLGCYCTRSNSLHLVVYEGDNDLRVGRHCASLPPIRRSPGRAPPTRHPVVPIPTVPRPNLALIRSSTSMPRSRRGSAQENRSVWRASPRTRSVRPIPPRLN